MLTFSASELEEGLASCLQIQSVHALLWLHHAGLKLESPVSSPHFVPLEGL